MIDLLRLRPLALAPCLLLLAACPGKEGLLTDFDPSTTSDIPETSTGGESSTSNSVSTGGGVSTEDPSTAGETASPGETEGTAGTDTTFDPEDPLPQTVTSFTGGEESDTEGSGGPELPDPCADLGCGADQICVKPAALCDHEQDPPEFVYPPGFCADVPVDCEPGPLFESCLGEEFCGLREGFFLVDEDNLSCLGAPDCF